MAYINLPEVDDLQTEARAELEKFYQKQGFYSNFQRAIACKPQALKAFAPFAAAISDCSLKPVTKEIIHILVSKLNGCEY